MKRSTNSDTPILHICSPASPAGEDLDAFGLHTWDDLKRAVQKAIGPHWQLTGRPELIWAPYQPHCAGRSDDAARAADLQAALANERVRAIVPLRGGAWLLRILDRIDFGTLAGRRNPVYLFGYSEWTCLSLLAAQYPSAICVHHGVPLYMLSADPHKPLSQQQKQQRWRQVWASIRAILAGRSPKPALHGRLITGHALKNRVIQLTGGNLTLISSLAGTKFQPAAQARRRWLAIEDVNESIGSIDRKFAQMRLAGMLEGLAGVLAGGFHTEGQNMSLAVAQLLREHVGPNVPIVAGCNFGHFWPAAAFPIGRRARLLIGPRNAVRIDVDWGRVI